MMPVPAAEFRKVQQYHPTLEAVPKLVDGQPVQHAMVRLDGKRGGGLGVWIWGPNAKVSFKLFIDLTNIDSSIPDVWVLSPSDNEIRHFNIFRAKECAALHKSLPKLCWGGYASRWLQAEPSQRTLGLVLFFLTRFLQEQNADSKARI